MLLSMRKLTKVIELLVDTDDLEKAALLANYCIKSGNLVVPNNNEEPASSAAGIASLLKRVFNRYASKLDEVGLSQIAALYKSIVSANTHHSSSN